MKKLIPIVFILGMLSLIIQFAIQAITKHHEVDYSIITNNNSYMINEIMNVKEKEHIYTFKVTEKNNNDIFYFNFSHNYNKQDTIIKDIEYFNDGDLSCIFPIYKKKFSSNVFCNYKGVQVSSSYLKQINNKELDSVISKLKKEGHKFDVWNKKDTTPEVIDKGFSVYKKNLPSNIVFSMWYYTGFFAIGKDEIEQRKFLNIDRYENDKSYFVDNYMFVINTDDFGVTGYSNYYIFDVANSSKIKFDFTEQVSNNMYFNGDFEGNIYYTDLDKKKQFALTPKSNMLLEVGNKEDGFKAVKDGKLITVPAKDFLNKKVYFDKVIKNDKLVKLYNAKDIRKENDLYYFVSEDGNFYRANVNDVKHAILLFNFKSVSDWIVKEGNIMVVSEDTVYFYNDDIGLLPMYVNSELKYNYKNICNFTLKKDS